MTDSYKYKHRFEVDGKESVSTPTESNYSASLSHPANQVSIPASAVDTAVNISNKGTVRRIILRCKSASPTQLTAKINGSSESLKVDPILMVCGTITSVSLSNADADNTKTVEVTTISE